VPGARSKLGRWVSLAVGPTTGTRVSWDADFFFFEIKLGCRLAVWHGYFFCSERADVRPEIVWSRPVGLPVSFLFSLAYSSLIGLMLIFAKLRYWFIKIRVCGSISKKI
jgi:hypothetical protein